MSEPNEVKRVKTADEQKLAAYNRAMVALFIGRDTHPIDSPDLTVTTVTCLKHPWSVRLYDPKNMRIVKATDERKIMLQIQVSFDQARQTNMHAIVAGL